MLTICTLNYQIAIFPWHVKIKIILSISSSTENTGFERHTSKNFAKTVKYYLLSTEKCLTAKSWLFFGNKTKIV